MSRFFREKWFYQFFSLEEKRVEAKERKSTKNNYSRNKDKIAMSLHSLASVASHIQNVTRVNLAVTAIPFSRLNLAVFHHLYQQGFISSVKNGSVTGPDETPVDVTPDNIAKRRIWVGLKYRDTGSVITKFSLISKPAHRMKFTSQQIREFAAGKSVRNIKPVQPDELVLVRPHRSKDVLELSEAAHRNLAAELLCRVR